MTDTMTVYSSDDEEFRAHDLADLIEENGLSAGDDYFEADCATLTPADFTPMHEIDSVLERFDDQLYEHVGEIADADFHAASPAAREELQQLLAAWIKRHVNVGGYMKIVGRSRKKTVTAEDMEGHDRG